MPDSTIQVPIPHSIGAAYTAITTKNVAAAKNVKGKVIWNLTGLSISGYLNRQMISPRIDIPTQSQLKKLKYVMRLQISPTHR